MPHDFSRAATLVLATLFPCGTLSALPIVHDQSDMNRLGGFSISSSIAAADVVLVYPTRIDSVLVWLADTVANDSGALENFGGSLSYAFYTNAVGGGPFVLLQSGNAIAVEQFDTGLQTLSGEDIVAVRFELQTPSTFDAGPLWLAIHEGEWGSAFDGSEVEWQITTSVKNSKVYTSADEANPGGWVQDIVFDAAFMLFTKSVLWDQSTFSTTEAGVSITLYVTANDFLLPGTRTFSCVDAWIMDGTDNDNGVLDDFSGELSWAVYTSVDERPTSEIAHGSGQRVRIGDAGVQADDGAVDLQRVRFSLGRGLTLAAGTYWLALREGAWLAPADDSPVAWVNSTQSPLAGVWVDEPETTGAWPFVLSAYNSAFVLSEDLLLAAGFESGTTCAFTSSTGGGCS